MITFEQVTNQCPDGTVAVDGLSRNVPDGQLTGLELAPELHETPDFRCPLG